MKKAVILFAHGSRDPQWARPFERIAEELQRRLPDTAVRVAYLETMRPTLAEAVAALGGVDAIRVVPLFLGQGGHVKEDLPRIVSALQDPRITLAPPIGEDPAIVEAIATAIEKGVRTIFTE